MTELNTEVQAEQVSSEGTQGAVAEAAAPAQPETTEHDLDKITRDIVQLTPMFFSKVEELSNRQLKRVISAMMEWPFKHDIKFSYKQETELFNLGTQLLDTKFSMFNMVLRMKGDEIKQRMGVTEEPKKEEANG